MLYIYIYIYISIAKWLKCWIQNPEVLCSKPLGGSKVDLAFHLPEFQELLET